MVSAQDIAFFADFSGDHNSVHIDPEFAQKTRFKGVIAHGMIAAIMISAVLGTDLPGPDSIYLNQTLKFIAPVRPGDEITAEVLVKAWNPEKKIITLDTRCFNQLGKDMLVGEGILLVDELTG